MGRPKKIRGPEAEQQPPDETLSDPADGRRAKRKGKQRRRYVNIKIFEDTKVYQVRSSRRSLKCLYAGIK